MEDDGKTRIIRRNTSDTEIPSYGGDSEATQYINTIHLDSNTGITTDAPTRVMPVGSRTDVIESASNVNRTTIYRPGLSSAIEKDSDPVVGWVVITKGKGFGKSFELGQGNNSIGKNSTNKVVLNFGDETISREEHLKIVYDNLNLKFWAIQNGASRNLAYINKSPVLVPVELKPFDVISLGATDLKFVPFCGENHSWIDS